MAEHGPVIASSNRYLDLAPYCGHIYAAEYSKWREVLPWEFPPVASKEEEEAFLRKFFTDQEIHMQGAEPHGFRFLKQVWYCIAIWNVQWKVPSIADQWMHEFKSVIEDPEMYQHMRQGQLSAYFSTKQVDEYGEKVLKLAVQHIQWVIEQSRKQAAQDERKTHVEGGASLAKDAGAMEVIDAIDGKDHGLQLDHAGPTELTKSGEAQASLTPNDLAPAASQSDLREFAFTGRPRAESSASTGYALVPQNRKRGMSNTKLPYNRSNTAFRYDPRHSDVIFSSPYPQPANFDTAMPSIGNDRRVSDMQQHAMQQQMPMPPATMEEYMHPSSMHQQQVEGPSFNNSTGPGMPFDRRVQYFPPGFAPIQHHNGPQTYDPNASRNDDRSFSNETPNSQNPYKGNSGQKRRESNASRGGGRPHVNSNHARAKGSRGRFSFNDPRPQNNLNEVVWAQHGGYTPAEFGHGGRRYSAFNNKWRGNEDHSLPQQNENEQRVRAFSGPESFGAPPPGYGPPSFQDAGLPSKPMQQRTSSHLEARRPSQDYRSNIQQNILRIPHCEPFTPIEKLLHDPSLLTNPALRDRVITEDSIGRECGHVTKLVIFNVLANFSERQVGELFECCGPILALSFMPGHNQHNNARPITFITFRDNQAASKALKLNDIVHLGGVALTVKVPREYWFIAHDRYPGQGHPQQPPFVSKVNRQHTQSFWERPMLPGPAAVPETSAPSADHQHDDHLSGDSTPTAKLPAHKELQKELLSGSTTPTPSGRTSPKKNTPPKMVRKKNKKREVPELTKQNATVLHDRVAKEAERSDSAVRATSAPDGTAIDSKMPPQSPAATVDAAAEEDLRDLSRTGSSKSGAKDLAPISSSGPLKSESDRPLVSGATSGVQSAGQLDSQEYDTAVDPVNPVDGLTPIEEKTTDSACRSPLTGMVEVDTTAAAKTQSCGEGSPGHSSDVPVSPKTHVPATAGPEKIVDETIDESFHTANGTPDGQKQSRGMLGRESDESPAIDDTRFTSATNISGRSRAGTIIHRLATPPIPRSHETLEQLTPVSTPGEDEVTEAATQGKAAPESRNSHVSAATLQHASHPPVTAGRSSPVSSDLAFTVKPMSKKAPVALPKVKIVEPQNSAQGDTSNFGQMQRSASGASVPPTPGFVTAPTTPAVPEAPETAESDTGSAATESRTLQQQHRLERSEKAKGPAQTASLLGNLFAKPQSKRPKKLKPQKGKGSVRGKAKADDDGSSQLASEDLPDRIISGISELTEQADKLAPIPAVLSGDIPGPIKELSRESSPSKARTALGSLISFWAASKSTPAPAPEAKPEEDSMQSHPGNDMISVAIHKLQNFGNPANASVDAKGTGPSAAGGEFSALTAPSTTASVDTALPVHFQQPFRSIPESAVPAGISDSGHSGGGDVAESGLGLGINTAGIHGADTAAGVSHEAKIKKKKKKAGGKKKKGKEAEQQDTDAAEVRTTGPSGDDEDGQSDVAKHDSPTEAKLQTFISESMSETSSHTMGHANSREQTPSSTTAGSALNSPSRMANLIKKQGEKGVLVEAPNRKLLNRRKPARSASATKTPEPEGSPAKEEAGKGTRAFFITEKADNRDDADGNALDRLIEKSITKKPPLLYVYVGQGKNEEKPEKARVEEVSDSEEGLDETAAKGVEGAKRRVGTAKEGGK
ncbi:hypothetical protein LTR53_010154 [Teratosphaeriaceae sp. CCFEE 6253]|nr:hypothetical protein LTR53_010154 [Teratosphaeriaceae sp. CCFEE 6253]